MTTEADKIVGMALLALPDDVVPTEEQIREVVQRLATAFGVTSAIKDAVLRQVLARRLVRMDTGYAVAEDHDPWVNARRPEIDPFYWSRFKLLLQKEWAPNVITALDRTTDEILDLMGNPKEPNTWKRRGLVMGDVQSGKTATYSALICKAADAGYRFIVLLTGTIENLRRQTQERLDIGFVGFDSSELLKRNGRDISVGVGLLDARRKATVFTSSHADFVATTLQTLGLTLNALREPALVVIKKHPRILANLKDWIRSYNTAGTGTDGIDIPMLLIDDEADNASINTADPECDPTRVNAGIRTLLSLFRRTTYVGFTATPFANIFVDPDSQEEMLGDDLFPRDFIYTLQAPTNYFGPKRIFLNDKGAETHLRVITDAEDSLPARHKSDYTVPQLPPSLVEAMRAFFVGNAIRDLRGDPRTHRSMLINVSQFTKVQDQVEVLVHGELERAQTAIRNFSALPPAKALEDPWLRALHDTWQSEYSDCGCDWPAVQSALHNAVLPITTKAVNQRTGPRALDYRSYRESGLRIIAVGGNSLSRGLTLEGLMVSYFRRSTKMYDTLLQMGRWFGYRPGYEDLCRVWLPSEAIDWYGHISDSTEELRSELQIMYRSSRTPKDFGLAVRSHPDSLLVTARNKMRTATEVTRVISLSRQSFESVELPARRDLLVANYKNVCAFLKALALRIGDKFISADGLIRGANRNEVADLLKAFNVPLTEFRFQPRSIAELLDSSAGHSLDEWDVAVPQGNGGSIVIPGFGRIEAQQRRLCLEDPPGVYVVSGDKRRVGSRGVEKAGLSPKQIEDAEGDAKEEAAKEAAKSGSPVPQRVNVADKFYRYRRTRPLLLLHFIEGSPIKGQNWKAPDLEGGSFVAIGLSLPKLDDDPAVREVRYRINLVKAREVLSDVSDPGDDFDPAEELA